MGEDFFDIALMYIIIDAHSSQYQITLLICNLSALAKKVEVCI